MITYTERIGFELTRRSLFASTSMLLVRLSDKAVGRTRLVKTQRMIGVLSAIL